MASELRLGFDFVQNGIRRETATRELVKKGHNVSAGTLDGHNPQRSIESHRIHAWLQE